MPPVEACLWLEFGAPLLSGHHALPFDQEVQYLLNCFRCVSLSRWQPERKTHHLCSQKHPLEEAGLAQETVLCRGPLSLLQLGAHPGGLREASGRSSVKRTWSPQWQGGKDNTGAQSGVLIKVAEWGGWHFAVGPTGWRAGLSGVTPHPRIPYRGFLHLKHKSSQLLQSAHSARCNSS